MTSLFGLVSFRFVFSMHFSSAWSGANKHAFTSPEEQHHELGYYAEVCWCWCVSVLMGSGVDGEWRVVVALLFVQTTSAAMINMMVEE